jgi:hypothetical protein
MWRAESILNKEHSLDVLSDLVSDVAVSVYLFFVNANNITEEMLNDAKTYQLMATRLCKLKPAQKNWAVWEKELWGKVLGVNTWGNYITTVTASFPKNDETAKVACFTDSTTARAKWRTLSYKDIVFTTKLDANGRLDDIILRSRHNQGIMP